MIGIANNNLTVSPMSSSCYRSIAVCTRVLYSYSIMKHIIVEFVYQVSCISIHGNTNKTTCLEIYEATQKVLGHKYTRKLIHDEEIGNTIFVTYIFQLLYEKLFCYSCSRKFDFW